MIRRVLSFLAVLVLLVTAWNFLSPSRRLLAAQRSFLEAVSGKDEARCLALAAEDYRTSGDSPGRSGPGCLRISARWLRCWRSRRRLRKRTPPPASVKSRLIVKAMGPAAEELQNAAVRSPEPVTFTWRRASWLPWSWRLTSIQFPGLEVPPSYRPGSLQESSLF